MPRDFRSIKAWQHAHQLTLAAYLATARFPLDERFGMTSQLRRATSSVAANLAEGSSRRSRADFVRFLEIALGSLRETEYFLLLAHDLKFLGESDYTDLTARTNETARTLTGLINALTKAAE